MTVSGKRSRRVMNEPLPYPLQRTVKPNRDSVIFQNLPVTLLNKRAASQRDNPRSARLNSQDISANGCCFQVTKNALAAFAKDLRYRHAFLLLNLAIDVGKPPSQFRGQHPASSGFPACHEAGEVKPRSAL